MVDNTYLSERFFYKKYHEIIHSFQGKNLRCIQFIKYSPFIRYITVPDEPPDFFDEDEGDIGITHPIFVLDNVPYTFENTEDDYGNIDYHIVQTEYPITQTQYFYDKEMDELLYREITWITYPINREVRRVVPFYDAEDFDDRIIGFTLIFDDYSISFPKYMIYRGADNKCWLVNQKAPKYIKRIRCRKIFAAMQQWVTDELQRRNLPPIPDEKPTDFTRQIGIHKYYERQELQYLFSSRRLDFTYSPAPSAEETKDILIEMAVNFMEIPVPYMLKFCELQCTENPDCAHCPLKEDCNQNHVPSFAEKNEK